MTRKTNAPIASVLLSALCLAAIASAQSGWWRTYGGTNTDVGSSVRQTTDGGYIVAGNTSSFGAGDPDVYLIKTSALGDTLWTRTYGGPSVEYGTSVQQTADGGCVIAGCTYSYGAGDVDVYLIKTDSSGDTLWTKTCGGPGEDWGTSVQQTTDGDYIITGHTWHSADSSLDVYLIKTDSVGDTLWTRTYGGSRGDGGYSVQQTADGGYIVTGGTWSYGAGYDDVYLIKINPQGDTIWTRTYGGTNYDCGTEVRQTADNGYVIAGITSSFGAGTPDSSNVYLIKTNALGDTLWTRAYGGVGNDESYSVQQTADGGYIVAGYTSSHGAGGKDAFLIKTDSAGDTLWTRAYGGPNNDEGVAVQATDDNGYAVAGYTCSFGAGTPDYSNVYLIKTDDSGNTGMQEPLARRPASSACLIVRPDPCMSFASVPDHETELFTVSDIAGRRVAVCKGDRVGEGLRPGIYFLSPVDRKPGKAMTATVIKAGY